MKIGMKVNTPDGIGMIVRFEKAYGIIHRYGIKHDIPNMDFKDGVMYYFKHELEEL